MSTAEHTQPDQLRGQIRDRYANAARQATAGAQANDCGCATSCCAPDSVEVPAFGPALYSTGEQGELPETALLASLGCGNPTAVAELHQGETVLDLGSGGGIDVLLSAKRVATTGKVYGLDMTEEMLTLALRNAAEAGATNVEFLKGHHRADPPARPHRRSDHLQLRDQPLGRQASSVRRNAPRPRSGRTNRNL
jgi:arsenite methyltransferase